MGVSGTELSDLERAWLRLIRPGGVILFRRNIAEAAQTRSLLAETAALAAPHSLRCVDLEGGTVDRLRDALAPSPAAQCVARTDALLALGAKTKSRRGWGTHSFAFTHGELIARAVRAFGFNVTLAPVLDLALPASAQVMGTRSTGATTEEVVAYARPFLAGLASQSVAGCGKHFPGLGGGTLDSHLETPQIERRWPDLWREDIAPYRELHRELPMIMVSHAAFPLTRSGKLPASASPFWITTVLCKRLGYRGLIFSDDMEMGGILKAMPMEEAAVASIRAGTDTIEICHSPELILRAYESLIAEAERSAAFRALLTARAREAARKRARIVPAQPPKALTPKQYTALGAKILAFRDKVLSLAGESSAMPAASAQTSIAKSIVETA